MSIFFTLVIDNLRLPSILSAGDIANFRFSNIGTKQEATKNCGSIDLSDDNLTGRVRNTLKAFLKPKWSLHLATFNIRMLNLIRQ